MVALMVLKSLWLMLEPVRRFYFVVLIALLCVSGVFEMAGMLVIFGFIRGLSADEDTGERYGGVATILERVLGRQLNDQEFVLWGGGAVLAVILLKNIQSLVVRYQLSRFLSNLNHRIAQQLFAALLTVPYEDVLLRGNRWFRDRLKETLAVFSNCFHALAQILADGTLILMVVALLIYIDPILTVIVAVLFGAVGVAIYQLLQKALRRMGRQRKQVRKKANSCLNDGFGGLVEARLRDNVRFFLQRYRQAMGERVKIERKRGALRRIPRASNEMLLATSIIGSVVYMVMTGSNLEQALPTLGIFGFAGLRANTSMSRINTSFQLLRQKAEVFEEMLEEVSRVAPQVIGSNEVRVVSYLSDEKPLPEGRDGRLRGSLRLEDVSFRYPGTEQDVLKGLSLTIKQGQFASFCGESGGGKSTLVMLLIGLLKPTSGAVMCDEWSVHEHIRAWHRNIGYVGQFAYISPGTVRENVAFGVKEEAVDDDKVWRALELAAAKEFVTALPGQLNAKLRVGGLRLSGGQRQRIVIARALYHDPDIVIFDEATAALDNATEREITNAAVRLSSDKTVICVAHRLSSIKESDVIFVLRAGTIEASGTYEELLEKSPAFRRLAASRSSTDAGNSG